MRNKPSNRRFLPLSIGIASLLTAMVAWAAITGRSQGLSPIPAAPLVPGATVACKQRFRQTSITRRLLTPRGFMRFPLSTWGHYDVLVSQTGFRNFRESGVTIDANSAVRIDVKMELGAVTNTVSVQSDVLQVETQSTQMGDVIEGKTITSVPLNGRSFIDLLALQPGVSRTPIQPHQQAWGSAASRAILDRAFNRSMAGNPKATGTW